MLVKTISNSIKADRIPQAYIFTGIRGIGKTTTARIIAKTINCSDVSEQNGIVVACEKCSNCLSFDKGNHPDIIEIDAASKTGIDDIREIIESARYRPLQGRYKVYIIDEIHMLSKNAFNALLKTLEEPPEHLLFILATTEINKVPVTVISRCQRFDLKRFSSEVIIDLLKFICQSENFVATEDALKFIATKSEGSARDACSLLDQMASYALLHNNGEITLQVIDQLLGNNDQSQALKLIESIVNQKVEDALGVLRQVFETNQNFNNIWHMLLDLLAELCKYKTIKNYDNPELNIYHDRITHVINYASMSSLLLLWQIMSNGLKEINNSHNILANAEMVVMKAIHASSLASPYKLARSINISNSINAEDKVSNEAENKLDEHQDISINPPRQFSQS